MTSEHRRLRYVPALDGIRAIAVLLVVMYHTYSELVPRGIGFFRAEKPPLRGCFIGVDVFFALSGFLITALLLGEQDASGSIRIGAFYLRRALRLLPAVVAVLVATTVYSVVSNDLVSTQLHSILPVLLYYANWTPSLHHTVAPWLLHTWSLSLEEQFYFVWPFVIATLLTLRRRPAFVVSFILGLLVAADLYRAFNWHPTYAIDFFYPTTTRADALLVGALAAHLWVRGRVPRHLAAWAWAGVVVLAVCVTRYGASSTFYWRGGLALVGLATAAIVVGCIEGRWLGARVLAFGPLRAIGRVSYGIYLWHAVVFVVVQRHAKSWTPLERIALAYAVTTVLVLVSWHVIEQPFSRLKSRVASPVAPRR